MDYPVLEVFESLKEKLAQHPVVILQAPPGAGKSTILPWKLLNETWLHDSKIIMLEPRKLAARAVANRMSSLLNEEPGHTIGYRVRFENVVSKATRCEVVTEGILTRMIQGDSTLEGIGLIIFDEFHERSLHADLALALTLQVQQLIRPDLKILIMSATLDTDAISAVLNNAPVVSSKGRHFPVTIKYLHPDKDDTLAQSVAKTIIRALREQQGDILTFLPGSGDIHRVQTLLEQQAIEAIVCPLYGDLPFKKQQEAILKHPTGIRKVVLSTSIAETSLTIEGVTTVVDSGYSRTPKFDPRSGLTRLETIRITKDAADQRAGRAGRLGPGTCYRLWSEGTQSILQPTRQPEILEADLAPVLLELFQWGVQAIGELMWITAPPSGALGQARDLLQQLGAVDEKGITEKGKQMLRLPTHPRLAHMLLSDASLVPLATDLAAVLEERDPLEKGAGADVSQRIEVLRKWRASERVNADRNALERIDKLASIWRKIFHIQPDNNIPDHFATGRLILEAYPERIAKQLDKFSSRYKLTSGRVVRLSDHDTLIREPWLAIAQLDAGGGEGRIFLAAPVSEKELLPRATEATSYLWNSEKGMITGSIEKRLGNVIFSTQPISKIPEHVRIKVLTDAIHDEGLPMIGWGEAQEEWQARVLSLRAWRPDEGWPDVSSEHLLDTLTEWLSPFISTASRQQDLAKLDLHAILTSLLPWELVTKLETLAPSKLAVPSGSMIKLHYHGNGSTPVIQVRLQEVFGLTETPTVNAGRTKVLLHLLSPGYKPVQVTQDLKSFWQTAYHEVRKELRIRYPRHHWPEDPWTAEAVRGAKRRGH